MSEPTPEQDARVRRLLAQARHDEPMPADVVARLDGVLAGLRAEDATRDADRDADDPPTARTGDDTGPRDEHVVVDLAARRRRLTALVAAAALVVGGGLGVQQLVAGSMSASDSAAGGSTSADSGAAERQARGNRDSDLADGVGPAQRRAYAAATAAGLVPRVRSGRVRADLLSAQRVARSTAQSAPEPATSDLRTDVRRSAARAVEACAPVGAGAGRRLPVRYDGVPAVLVLRPPADGRQRVAVYACGGGRALRSVVLPVR